MTISDYLIIQKTNHMNSDNRSQYYPLVSFCIPTKNRERTIKACLESIKAQEYPRIEIVVIDNGSIDKTIEIANQYADIIEKCDGPLGAVRQKSIDKSSGDILALFDDDIIIPHPFWLKSAIEAFNIDNKASTVWPVLIPHPSAGWFTRCFFDLNEVIFTTRRYRPTAVFGGGNSLFRRCFVNEVGGFNPRIGFGEDFDLASRLKQSGFRVILHEDPLIHDTMYSLREIYMKQKWGAEAVSIHGTSLLAQSYKDIFNEQVVAGIKAMIIGLLVQRRPWWCTFPIILVAKILPYSRGIFLQKIIGWRQRG